MTATALIIVDVQKGIVNDKTFRKDAFLAAVRSLLDAARKKGVPVLYVRHDDGEGEALSPGHDAWNIADEVAPLPGEAVVDKRRNSAFFETDLQDRLNRLGAGTLVLAGMMCEYCLDATVKSAFERGYSLVVPPEANTTSAPAGDIPAETLHRFYNFTVWNRRFASVVPVDEAIRSL